MGLDDFEKELFDSLDDYDSKMNIEEEWNILEANLPEPKKKKRKFFFWMFFGGVLSMIVLSLIFFNFNNDNNHNIHAAAVDQSTKVSPRESLKQFNVKDESEDTKDENELINNIPALNAKQAAKNIKPEIYRNQNDRVAPKRNLILDDNLNNNKRYKAVENFNQLNDNDFNTNDHPQIENTKNSLAKMHFQLNESAIPRSLSPTQNLEIVQNEITIKSQENGVATALEKEAKQSATSNEQQVIGAKKIKLINAPIAFLNLPFGLASHPKLSSKFPKEVVRKNTKNNILKRPLYSIAMNYSFGLNRFNRNHGENFSSILNFVNENETPVDFMKVQLKFYRKIHRNISIFIGINFNQHTNAFELNDQFDVERIKENILLEQTYLINGEVTEFRGIIPVSVGVNVTSKLWQKYRSIGIPVGVSLHSDKGKRWFFQNDLALSINPIQSISGQKIIRTATDYYLLNNESYETNFYVGLENQLFLNRAITSKLNIRFGLDLGIDLQSRLSTTANYSMKFSYLGVQTGLSYGF